MYIPSYNTNNIGKYTERALFQDFIYSGSNAMDFSGSPDNDYRTTVAQMHVQLIPYNGRETERYYTKKEAALLQKIVKHLGKHTNDLTSASTTYWGTFMSWGKYSSINLYIQISDNLIYDICLDSTANRLGITTNRNYYISNTVTDSTLKYSTLDKFYKGAKEVFTADGLR